MKKRMVLMPFLLVVLAFACQKTKDAEQKKEAGKPEIKSNANNSVATSANESVSITDPWVRKALKDFPSSGYMVLQNNTKTDETLIGIETGVCESAELHEMSDGKMRKLESGIPIPAGGSIDLKPGGYHIMLFELKQTLEEGKTVNLKLKFKSGKELVVNAIVKSGPGEMEHSMHDHH